MNSFFCKTRILSGPGSCSFLKTLGARRLFLVTDPYFSGSGLAEKLARDTAPDYEIFDGVEPDPSAALAARGTKLLRDYGPDLVVALGGGSAMDCAKAMVYFSGTGAPLAAVPTTSGSGSEVTGFAILTHDGVKHPLVDPKLTPDYAILDSDLLKDLPKSLIADAGFDVLAHALEAVAARNASPVTDALAERAFAACFAALPASYAGDVSRRLPVHLASSMAAMAFSSAGLGLCHALSHALGGAFHIPHGRLNAILLPAVVGANAPAAREKYAALARQAGLSAASDAVALRNLLSGLRRLRRELRLPGNLSEAGVSPAAFRQKREDVIAAALRDGCAETNPVTPTAPLCRRILEEVLGDG